MATASYTTSRDTIIASKYLDSYLAWYHLAVLPKAPTPRSVLAPVAGLIGPRIPESIANAN